MRIFEVQVAEFKIFPHQNINHFSHFHNFSVRGTCSSVVRVLRVQGATKIGHPFIETDFLFDKDLAR